VSAATFLAAAALAVSSSTRAQRSATCSRRPLCPLGVALALLAQRCPQVLGLGVGAFAQLVGIGCPLRS